MRSGEGEWIKVSSFIKASERDMCECEGKWGRRNEIRTTLYTSTYLLDSCVADQKLWVDYVIIKIFIYTLYSYGGG